MVIKKFLILILMISCLGHYCVAQEGNQILVNKSYYGKTLSSVLADLGKSYDLEIDFRKEDIPMGIVSGKTFNKSAIKDVLGVLLFDTDLHYKMGGNKIVIRKKSEVIVLVEPPPENYEPMVDFTLSGLIRDSKSGESLPFANLRVKGTNNGTATNVDGYFTLFRVPNDSSELMVMYMGYEEKTIRLSPAKLRKKLVIELDSKDMVIEEVTVAAEREDLLQVSREVSMVSISPKQINSLPSIGEKDIFRSFQLLPGISGSNESSSGLYVRGGTPDQNLILYDGFTVYHVDHLFGMFSAFNSNAIKDVKMSKGGFESKFGGRLSSVMEVTGKDGNEKKFSLGGGISLLSLNGFAEMPLGGNGSLIVSGRRSFKSFIYNTIFDQFDNSEDVEEARPRPGGGGGMGGRTMAAQEPSSYFYDLNAKATYKFQKDIISYSFFNGQDELDNSNVQDINVGGMGLSGGTNDITRWGNWGMSNKWSRKWNDRFYSNALLSYSKYFSLRDQTMERTIVRDDTETLMTGGTLEDNTLQDFTVKIDNELKTGRSNQIEFGAQLSQYDIDYDYVRNDTIIIQERHDLAYLATFYLQDKLRLYNKLSITPGFRTSYYTQTEKVYYEPRLSMKYELTEKIRLKAAYGKYYQFANRIIRNDLESGSRDFWVLSDDQVVPVSSSVHYIAGIAFETNDFLIDIEAFHKDLYSLSEYSLTFTPSFLNVDFDEFFYIGDGVSEGVEFLLQKKFGKYTGWMGYTLSEVMYDFPIYGDESFPANHDATHEFKFVNSYKWRNWNFSGTWIYATGKPYTAPTGAYDLEFADGTSQTFLSIGSKNGFRLPDYHRLDLSATLEFAMGDAGEGTIGFSIFNLYNRKNVWYKTFEVIDDELIETDVNLLGITPNISFSFKF